MGTYRQPEFVTPISPASLVRIIYMPGPPEMLIVLAVVLLLFGGAKLPKLARSLGEAQREFKDGQVSTATEDGLPPAPSEIRRP